MARLVGINIPDNKRVEVALTYIYGIGLNTSHKILDKMQINPDIRVKDLASADLEKIRSEIESHLIVEGDLRTQINSNIKRLRDIGCYRGIRHTKKLPVRGQRTKTNARTKRGRRMTVGSGRKPAAQKT